MPIRRHVVLALWVLKPRKKFNWRKTKFTLTCSFQKVIQAISVRGGGAGGAAAPPVGKKSSIIRAQLVYRSGKDTVKNILLFNISIHLFSSRNSPNLLNDPCPTSRDGLLGVRTLSSAEGLGMIVKTALGLELRMISLAAVLIYVSSRVHVYLVD